MNNNNISNNKLVSLPISKRIDFIYNFIMEFGTNINYLDFNSIFNILGNCHCCLRHNTNRPSIFENNSGDKEKFLRLLNCPCPCRFISRILFKKMVLVNVSPSLPFYNKEIIIDNSPSTIPFDIFINIMKMRSDLIKIDIDKQRKLKNNVLNQINDFSRLYKSINNKNNTVRHFFNYIRYIKNGYSSDQIFEFDILYSHNINYDSENDFYHEEEYDFDDYYPEYYPDDYPDEYDYDDYDDDDDEDRRRDYLPTYSM